jgi:hypothetical protein
VDVKATNSEGTSPISSADRFHYEVGPQITNIVPRTGPPAGGTTVTITGSNLAGVSAVRFGSTDAESFQVDSNTSITAVAPPGTGTVDVRLTNPEATSAAEAVDRYSYSEGPPEFGRCVKVAKGTGTSAGGEQKYEWARGPGPNNHFTTSLKKPLILEGATSKSRLYCSGATGSGEITGPGAISVTLRLTGCEDTLQCGTKGASAGEIQLTGYTGALGVIKAGETALKDKIGLTLEGEASFECGGGLVQVQVHGSAIGAISPTNSMTSTRTWTFALTAKTRQSPEQFEGGGPQMWEEIVNGTPERAAFSLQLAVTSAEKIEINTIV